MEFLGHLLDRLSFVVGRNGIEYELADERLMFLSTTPASAGSRRIAVAIVLVSVAVFFATAPFAKTALTPVWPFIPLYEAALIVVELVTAALLFGQFSTVRSRALLALAGGYLFTACMAVAHTLSFPGLFSQTGLLDAGPQSTAWIYMFWHGGFPLFVVGYSLLQGSPRLNATGTGKTWMFVASTVALSLGISAVLIAIATTGHDGLPAIMDGGRYTSTMTAVVSGVWVIIACALALLWLRRPHSLLDNWLLVTLCAWIFDVALSAVLNAGRFDLGFYVGRIYGFLAASFVLTMLLLENARLYTRVVEALADQQEKTEQLAAANRELEAFSYSISHDLQSPLRTIHAFSSDLLENHASEIPEVGRNELVRVIANARRMQQLIEDLLNFSRLNRQPLSKRPVDLAALVNEVVNELRTPDTVQHLEFHIEALPECVGDPSLLKQALLNLLSNAVKFTRGKELGMIEVSCRKSEFGDVYVVRDNGAGFDMQYAKTLFGVFQRLHQTEEFPGTGIGLSIVKRIVERHGGRVWAEAKPGAGAAFYFTLRPDNSSYSL
jgi:signal transduction histidine kinase